MPDLGAIGIGGAGTLVIGGEEFDWQATLISQYANSEHLYTWIENFAGALEEKSNIDALYDLLWNIQTAQGYGLDVWGRIVVINRTLQVLIRDFGFAEGAPDYDPFDVSPFYSGGRLTDGYTLPDSAYRVLILAKAAANIAFGSIPGLNHILQLLFPGRPCYVADNQDMTMTYTFGFLPSGFELAIIENSNVLPRPTGVKVLVSVSP